MKIDFTKKEYRALLELLGMADWVVNSHSAGGSANIEKYSSLVQRICSHSKEMGCDDIIEYEKELNEYYPTSETDANGESRKYIDLYNENIFWGKLIAKLADRDVIEKHGSEVFSKMPNEERFAAIGEAEELWASEFEANGLERIGVSKT